MTKKNSLQKSIKSDMTNSLLEKITENTESDNESKKKKITIKLEAYKNIETIFPICDIQTECIYNEVQLGVTELIPITDNEILPIESTFVLEIDTNNPEELNILISTPAILKVHILPGSFDLQLYEQLAVNPHFAKTKTKSFDSVVSIYEALTDDKIEEFATETINRKSLLKKERSKTDRGKKDKASDQKLKKQSITSSTTISDAETSSKITELKLSEPIPVLYGECIVDFIPFFYGQKCYKESLLMKQWTVYKDDRMKTYKTHPKIIISLEIDEPLIFKHSMIMNFSVESIFNYPNASDINFDAQICWVLPKSDDSYDAPIIFTNPVQTEDKMKSNYKLWPNNYGVEGYPTKYVRNTETDDIKCKFEEHLDRYFKKKLARLEFNVIKRNFFQQEGRKTIEEIIKVHKNILLEIYVCPKSRKKSLEKVGFDLKSCTHLMAIVDVSGLLYPGARKIRVATQLRTFSLEEVKNTCGVEQSYFRPNLAKEEKIEEQKPVNQSKKDFQEKEKKNAPKSVRSSRKSLKTDSVALDNPLKRSLIQQEVEDDSSKPVYNEMGHPCFLIVELELSETIIEMRDIEDLSNRLMELIHKEYKPEDKIVLTSTVARDYYVEVLNEIIGDMNQKFIRFLEENPKFKDKTNKSHIEFVKFLQNIGAYKLYLNTITRAISIVATSETKFKEVNDCDSTSTQNFIGEIFCFLVSRMHDTVNGLVCNGLQVARRREDDQKALFKYAKEAVEFGMTETANRYFLERVSNDENNADYWFDYAVFFLEQLDFQRALECVRNALAKNSLHKYCLIIFAILVDNKNQKEEAETAFLNLMIHDSKWVEGWGILYLFYYNMANYVSMEWALEMAKKNLTHIPAPNYFTEFEDLAWSSKRYPNRVFLRTAILLIKLRILDWAEMACSQEIHTYNRYSNELLAVICYYKKLFNHAIRHLEESKSSKNVDSNIIALSGHCLLGINKKEEAKKEYYYILTTENNPEQLHLVYINCAHIMEILGDTQEARKLILLACKYNPSPFTWFKAGYLYYQQLDFLSAEECFSHANSLDTRNALIWGYLTLINLKLIRFNEARLCYDQAIKYNLNDDNLLSVIEEERRKLSLDDLNSLT